MSGDRAVLLDLKHGTVPFVGSRPEMDERLRSLLDKCKSFQEEAGKALCVAQESELGEDELDYMLDKRRIPRRVEMRLKARTSK